MGESARRKTLGVGNSHDGTSWKKRERQFKAFLCFTVIKVVNLLARREGRA